MRSRVEIRTHARTTTERTEDAEVLIRDHRAHPGQNEISEDLRHLHLSIQRARAVASCTS